MKKPIDILVVGELNVDLILNDIEKFPEVGKEVLAKGMALTLGSSSAIFASNISSLGARVAFLGKIGRDKFGEVVLESLQPGIKNDVGKLFRLARNLGLTTSFDMQWDPREKWDLDIEAILPYVNVFLPNEMELIFLTGKRDLHEAIDNIKKVTDILVVKRGNKSGRSCLDNSCRGYESF